MPGDSVARKWSSGARAPSDGNLEPAPRRRAEPPGEARANAERRAPVHGKRPRIAFLLKRSTRQVFLRERSDGRLKTLLRRHDPTVARLRATHESHERTVELVFGVLHAIGADVTAIDGTPVDLRAKSFDLVVTVGGDGTLLRASHSVADVPILGVNSAPDSSVGFFCGANPGNARRAIESALEGKLPRAVLARMSVTKNGRVVASRVLNDALYCHRSPAATSRYIVELGDVVEEHKSSGFWIGPAAGSTAAQRSAGGRVLPLESHDLQLVVREPYTPLGERYRVKRTIVRPGQTLLVRSKMRDGQMFFDGPAESEALAFGDVVTFALSKEPLTLLGISPQRRRAQRKTW
jgi:NAD+ kinase